MTTQFNVNTIHRTKEKHTCPQLIEIKHIDHTVGTFERTSSRIGLGNNNAGQKIKSQGL